ncbi:conserved hypothetical protein [Leishmania mexicana MHOM/GT/2001/U1103]|uniref:Uncharacterized protein n=1 Tax=Leishmania mexicana (strain MHOM/GT/2001/U1103) TaxID=929439 RepID=E9B6J1_LEIMU|nr:conserved hypothetical protein [Leishmania mexicana MHOM/GT/2001/U1103]CBZ30863.1 conserved hypothetical protein [Leishmania mexicana MHOM/GT/2001/U1103]
MHASKEVTMPQLAIVLGDEVSLATLQREWEAFPQGVSYTEFRQLLEPHARQHPSPDASTNASVAFLHSWTQPCCGISASSPPASVIRPVQPQRAHATAPVTLASAAFDDAGTNREAERTRRIRSRQELAGVTTRSVEPLKHLFNRVNVHNQQRITWEDFVNYLVAEASNGMTGTRLSNSTFNQFTFSRRLRSQSKHSQKPQKPKKSTSAEALTFRHYCRGVQDVPMGARPSADQEVDAGLGRAAVGVREAEDLGLIRFLDGLPGHKSLFFASTRSCPFMLYSKKSLERVYSAPPNMLPGVIPSAVCYLAARDLFVCYSPDDRLLRGWGALLSNVLAATTITPLQLEGLVLRIQAMPRESPTYADYMETIFLGNSLGQVLRVTAPHRRSGGTEFTVVQTYANLHTRQSGGLVDFCVYGAHLYSSGFDGRLVVTSLVTGKSFELGRVANEHLNTLVYVAGHDWVVAATSCGRQLLWWEAHSHGTLPGTLFNVAGHGEHNACIIALIYMAAADQVVSADCESVVKVWDASTQRCVQSFRSSCVPQRHKGSLCSVPANEAKASSANTRTAAHAGNLAGLFANLGLLALLPAGVGQASHIGGPQCHSLSYCASTQELLCGFSNSIVCWGLHSRDRPFACDEEEVCYDVFYDIRTRTFLVQGATRLSVWDGVHGYRRGVLSQVKESGVSKVGADIKAVCIDELGSRVFMSLSDGSVVWYMTQHLAADASQCTAATAAVWWHAKSFGSGAEGGGPPLVEQMHYSSISRTWIAITSNGTLLVRSEEDNQMVCFSTTISVSASPLVQLRVSEELGLVAVTDAQRTVYIYDMQAWMDAPVTKRLAMYDGLVDLIFLDSAPALVTVHAGGVCQCWSCAPAVERFKLLSVFYHPQHPTPKLASAATVEAERAWMQVMGRMHPGSTGAMRGKPHMQYPATSPCYHTIAATAPGSHNILQMTGSSASPLGVLLPKLACFSRSGSASVASRPTTPARGASQRSSLYPLRLGSILEGTSADQTQVSGEGTSSVLKLTISTGRAATDAPRDTRAGDGWTATAATPTASVEFTSATYDGRQHHLFLGDSEGVVHTYSMCPVLQAYKLPRCTYASRPAFSLTAATEFTGADAGDGFAAPKLMRSVQVHLNQSTATEPGAEARQGCTYRGNMSTATRRDNDQCGVVCVRWLDDRGVLATSGYDHEVWFLDCDTGEKVACLSTERRLSRADRADQPVTTSRQHHRGLTQESTVLSGVLNGQRAEAASTLPSHSIFSLPQLPRYDDLNDASAAGFLTGASQLCCCTHGTRNEDVTATEEGRETVSPVPWGKEEHGGLATLPSTRCTPVNSHRPASSVGQRCASFSSLSRYSTPEMIATVRHDGAPTGLKDDIQGPKGAPGSLFLRPSSRSPTKEQALSNDVPRGWRPLSRHNTSMLAGNPLERGAGPRDTASAALSASRTSDRDNGTQIHISDWQKRDLMAMRESRGVKPHAPVQPGLQNTLVHVEESKWHSAETTGQPTLLGPADSVSRHVARTATAAAAALAATGAAVSQTEAASASSALSLTTNMVASNNLRGETAARAAETSGDIDSFGVKEDAVLIESCGTVNRPSCNSISIAGALTLCVSGCALTASAVDTDRNAAASQQERKQPHLPQGAHGGRIRSNSKSSSAVVRHGSPSRVPLTQPSASVHQKSSGARTPPKKALRKDGSGGLTPSSLLLGVTAYSPSQNMADQTQSFTSANALCLPPMLAYSNECEGRSTLEMYSSELRQCLRRPRRWHET